MDLNTMMRMQHSAQNPIFKPEVAPKIIEKLEDYFQALVISSTGKPPQDYEFFRKRIEGIVNWLTDKSSTKKNLLIQGNAGIGKSTLANAMKMMFADSTYKLYKFAISAKELGDIYRGRDDYETWDKLNNKSCKVLFIDDLGMEEDITYDYGSKVQPMIQLLHTRYENGTITIVTTNMSNEALREKYDDRIADRLLNGYCRLLYNTKSYRK